MMKYFSSLCLVLLTSLSVKAITPDHRLLLDENIAKTLNYIFDDYPIASSIKLSAMIKQEIAPGITTTIPVLLSPEIIMNRNNLMSCGQNLESSVCQISSLIHTFLDQMSIIKGSLYFDITIFHTLPGGTQWPIAVENEVLVYEIP